MDMAEALSEDLEGTLEVLVLPDLAKLVSIGIVGSPDFPEGVGAFLTTTVQVWTYGECHFDEAGNTLAQAISSATGRANPGGRSEAINIPPAENSRSCQRSDGSR
jgi:hypothetical protein